MTEFNWKAGDEVLVVKTGVANVASMLAGLRRAGATPVLVETGDRLLEAPRVVVPGVGAFGTAMKALHGMKLADVLVERITKRLPTMTVCLGLQILGHASEESPGVAGLGVVDASATRFTGIFGCRSLGGIMFELTTTPVFSAMAMSTLRIPIAGPTFAANGFVHVASTREVLSAQSSLVAYSLASFIPSFRDSTAMN